MFDALLSNEELPEKLAGIINQYVGRYKLHVYMYVCMYV